MDEVGNKYRNLHSSSKPSGIMKESLKKREVKYAI